MQRLSNRTDNISKLNLDAAQLEQEELDRWSALAKLQRTLQAQRDDCENNARLGQQL